LRFNYGHTLDQLNNYKDWLDRVNGITYDKIKGLAETGFLYPCGRSLSYRPLVVVNLERAFSKQSLFEADLLVEASDFILKYTEMEMGLPGTAEAFDVIVDLEDINLMYAPYETVRKIIDSNMNNFRGRNARIFIVNQTWVLRSITTLLM
jgi:hypothetical protein